MSSMQPQRETIAWLPTVKFVLLSLYLALDHSAVAARIISLGFSFELVAFGILYGALALALGAAALARPAPLRIALAAILAVGSVGLHSYEWTTGAPLVYEAFETMVASRSDASDAMAQHSGTLMRAISVGLVLFTAVALPTGRMALPYGLGWIIPGTAVVALAGVLYLRGGEGARALPAPFSPLAQSAIMFALQAIEEKQPRQSVTFAPGSPLITGDVVLVIDESVSANYLDINHRHGVRSGLAESRNGIALANFGIASSVANCSAGSNRTLRFGGTRDTYRQASEKMPSIWAYARRAGRSTVYLDGQRQDGELQNLMTPEEASEIDDFVQIGNTPVLERDHELARLLGERINNGVAELILVNKVGAHFPVADKFPLSAATFLPLPPRGRSVDITDIGSLPGEEAETEEDWRRYRNAYRNTVAWSTGGFFDRLLPRVANTDAVIVYTADHGQDLHERGGPGGPTHCVSGPRGEEGAVPLVVIAGSAAEINWLPHAKANFDSMSHFRIFPTLLSLLGYEHRQTKAFYGPTLQSLEKDPLTFTPNYNASLGREPSWYGVDRTQLAEPPEDDYRMITRAR